MESRLPSLSQPNFGISRNAKRKLYTGFLDETDSNEVQEPSSPIDPNIPSSPPINFSTQIQGSRSYSLKRPRMTNALDVLDKALARKH